MGKRGPAPGTVTKPEGSGRKKGQPNKSTREIKELARKHGPAVIEGLARIFNEADNDTARIAAGRELLDRAYGKASQPVDGDGEGGPIAVVHRIELVSPDHSTD